jgi:pyrroloquinoline-quinone synthase
MDGEAFWGELRKEIMGRPLTAHPICTDLAAGTLKRNTIAELCAQLKYTVTDGIGSLALIIPQAPRPLRAELAENLFWELKGDKRVPSHWELALRTGAAAAFSEAELDARPMLPETKVYPDTVSAYAVRGKWLEALSFVAVGIEDLFHEFSAAVTKALKEKYGFSDYQAEYFAAHIEADAEHGATGWKAARAYAKSPEEMRSVRRAALEGRNMWWNMYSAVYRLGEGKDAPVLRLEA